MVEFHLGGVPDKDLPQNYKESKTPVMQDLNLQDTKICSEPTSPHSRRLLHWLRHQSSESNKRLFSSHSTLSMKLREGTTSQNWSLSIQKPTRSLTILKHRATPSKYRVQSNFQNAMEKGLLSTVPQPFAQLSSRIARSAHNGAQIGLNSLKKLT